MSVPSMPRATPYPVGKYGALYLKNYRAFGAAGQVIPLAGINLLFGPNSAGKTSIFKAIHILLTAAKHRLVEDVNFASTVHTGDTSREIAIGLSMTRSSPSLAAQIGPDSNPACLIVHFGESNNGCLQRTRMEVSHRGTRTVWVDKDGAWTVSEFKSSPETLLDAIRWDTVRDYFQPNVDVPQVEHLNEKLKEKSQRRELSRSKLARRIVEQPATADELAIVNNLIGSVGTPFQVQAADRFGEHLASATDSWRDDVIRTLTNASVRTHVAGAVSWVIAESYEVGYSLPFCHLGNNFVRIPPVRTIPSRESLRQLSVSDTNAWHDGSPWDVGIWKLLLGHPYFLEPVSDTLEEILGYRLVNKQDGDQESSSCYLALVDTQGILMENVELDLTEVGSGVAQCIPVIGASYLHNDMWICIEQPELHLHPRLQAQMADLFVWMSIDKTERNVFLIETHSEHFLLRLLRRIRETHRGTVLHERLELRPEDLGVVYLEPTPFGTQIHRIEITPEGEFATRWPNGFFPERAAELFD